MTPRMHLAGPEDSVSAELFQMCSASLNPLGSRLLKLDIHTLQQDNHFNENMPSPGKELQLCLLTFSKAIHSLIGAEK